MKIAFITHYCTHYRVNTYETLARYADVDFYFYSQGNEWYWLDQHGVQKGDFHYEYLPGFRLGGTRITPTLPLKLLQTDYDVYIKCINGRFVLPMTYAIARLRQKPFVLWTGIWTRLQTIGHRFLFPFTRYLYRHSDAIVTYGEHVQRYLLEEGVPNDRIFTTKHAVENALYNRTVSESEKTCLRDELGMPPEQQVILYLGRLVPEKGIPYLIEAVAKLEDDTVLVIAGTGPDQEQLESLARDLGIGDRVRFVGYIPPKETILYYALASAYVLPSVTTPLFKEPWGLVVNEAFNQGVPVIATDAVGAAVGGLVKDGINGFVIPEGDSQAIKEKLHLILSNPGLRDKLSREARITISDWDNEHMVSGFLEAARYARETK
jgi:glycosyltransferase involved in cell wall biosynthesis